MSQPYSDLQHLLLDLLSPVRDVSQARLAALDAQDWSNLQEMAVQHRVEPLLYWQTKNRADLRFPDHLIEAWQKKFNSSTKRSLDCRRDLILMSRLLAAEQIPHVALKGSYLAFHAYPHPSLRPLRDIDLLVPREHALRAFHCLIQNGVSRMPEYPGDPTAALEFGHHLPPLLSSSKQLSIEIHPKLFHPNVIPRGGMEPSYDDRFWLRTIQRNAGKDAILFCSPTDLLLQLIVHAVYEHRFDNGPLTLSDIYFLLESAEIDWPLFWELAAQNDHTRGAILALRLVDHYWGGAAGDELSRRTDLPSASDDVLRRAAGLMLRDIQSRHEINIISDLERDETRLGKINFYFRKIFPKRIELAAMYPVRQDSWKVFLYYPKKWWRLLFVRMPEIKKSLGRRRDGADEIGDLDRVRRWLDQ